MLCFLREQAYYPWDVMSSVRKMRKNVVSLGIIIDGVHFNQLVKVASARVFHRKVIIFSYVSKEQSLERYFETG